MNISQLEDTLLGRLHNRPNLNKRIVRIFISSTFTDTKSERDYLIETIFPQLRDHCKKKYNLDFIACDMRWGVPSSAFEYHGTTEFCLKEIERSNKNSIGPTFVAILSHKYGTRFLPNRIEKNEFEIIENEMKQNEMLAFEYKYLNNKEQQEKFFIDNFMSYCFLLNTNVIPNEYELQPISKIIPQFVSNDKDTKELGNAIWTALEKRISKLFRRAADNAYKKGFISEDIKNKYFISTTEKELYEGIFNVENPNSKSLCFIREITNKADLLKSSIAQRFIDLRKDQGKLVVDHEAQDLLEDLKHKKVPKFLNKTNIFHYDVKWNDNGIDENDLKIYLDDFGQTFFREVTRLIDDAVQIEVEKNKINFGDCIEKSSIRLKTSKKSNNEISKFKTKIENDLKGILQEVSTHVEQCEGIIKTFLGRIDVINKIKSYILSDNSIPFTVIGQSGSGKTSLLGKAISLIKTWVEHPDKCILIYRFLGTTPSTSSIFKTYKSIALQLYFILCLLNGSWNTKTYDLVDHSHDLDSVVDVILNELNELRYINGDLRVVIVLDSLDQLTPSDFGNLNKWLILNLPKHVKLILSTITDAGNILKNIQYLFKKAFINQLQNTNPYFSYEFERKMKNSSELMTKYAKMRFWILREYEKNQSVEVSFLGPKLCVKILRAWLAERNKTLTEPQWRCLHILLSQSVLLPLYLRVLCDIILTWKSFYQPDNEFRQCFTIDKCIEYLFNKHEKTHGQVLFRKALFYMTVLKNGISETELEDILTLDDDVLYAVFEFHVPPIQRIPTVLWARLKDDLSEYLVEKEANDTTVIYWYHRRLVEVALKMYVDNLNPRENEIMFQNILDFYNETWKGRNKPLSLNKNMRKKLGLDNTGTSSDRHVSSQSIEFYTKDGVQYNKRKLTELPNALTMINSTIALDKACELVFYNYEFMHAKFKCETLKEIKDDLKKIISSSSSWNFNKKAETNLKSLKTMQTFLGLCGDLISDHPDSYGFQICSRLVCFYSKLDFLKKLIDECDKFSPRHCAFIAPFTQLPPPGICTCVISKHYDPISHLLYMNPYIITLSINRINVLIMVNQPESLFVVDIPIIKEAFYTSGNRLKLGPVKNKLDSFNKLKVLSLLNNYDEKKYKSNENIQFETPDSFPVSFILISKHQFFIINPNKQLKFAYQCDKEILDVHCLDQKHLIIIEKDNDSIKFIMNFDLKSRSYEQFSLSSSMNIKNSCTTSSLDYIRGPYHQITDLSIILEDNELRNYSIRVTSSKIDELVYATDHLNSEDNHCSSFFDSSSESDEDQVNYIQKRSFKINPTKLNYSQINENIEIKLVEKIAPSGINISSIFSNPHLVVTQKNVNSEVANEAFPTPKSIYVSYEDGTLAVFKSLYSFCQSDCFVFPCLTREPIKQIKWPLSALSGFCFAALTDNYAYIVHKNLKSRTKKMKSRYLERKLRNPFNLCCLELNDKFDLVQPINEDFFVAAKFNTMFLYKIKCFTKNHRTKLVASQVLHNKKITNIELIDNILLSTSADGVLKSWDILKFKKQKRIGFDFDTTKNKIRKLYTTKNRVATVCDFNEVSIWELSNGKIIKTIYASANITDVQFSASQNDIYVLLAHKRLFVYEDFDNRIQIDLNTNSNVKLTFLNRKVLNPKNKDKVFIFDELSSTLYQVNVSNGYSVKKYSSSEFLNSVDENDELDTSKFFSVVLSKDQFCKVDKTFKYYELINLKDSNKISKKNAIKFVNYSDRDKVTQWLRIKIFETIIHLSKTFLIAVLKDPSSNTYVGIIMKFDDSLDLEIHSMLDDFDKFAFYHSNICFLSQSTKILVKRVDENQNISDQMLNVDASTQITHLAIDKMGEYLVFIDTLNVARIYRIKNNKLIGTLPIYDEVLDIRFSSDSKYVCLGMIDKRLFILLVVDPEEPSHAGRIKELKSRGFNNSDEADLSDEDEKSDHESDSSSSESEEENRRESNQNHQTNTTRAPRQYLMENLDDEKANIIFDDIQNQQTTRKTTDRYYDNQNYYYELDSTDNQTEIPIDLDQNNMNDTSSDEEFYENRYLKKERKSTARNAKSQSQHKAKKVFKNSVQKILGSVKKANQDKNSIHQMVKKAIQNKNNSQNNISYFAKNMNKSLVTKFNRRQYELKHDWLNKILSVLNDNQNPETFFRELNEINTKNEEIETKVSFQNVGRNVKISNSVVSKGCQLL